MRKQTLLFPLIAVAALCAFLPRAGAKSTAEFSLPQVVPQPAIVTPVDTFNISVAGFDSSGTNGVYLIQPITATFGVNSTIAATGAGGAQTVTFTSSEAIGATTTTDTFTISVPTNFIPTGTTNSAGGVINLIEFDFGGYTAGTNTLDFATPLFSPTYTGSLLFSGGTLTLNPANLAANAQLTNNNRSLADAATISTTATAGLSQFAIRSFTFSVTYNNVPEPSTYALCALGLAGFAGVVVRRRRQALA